MIRFVYFVNKTKNNFFQSFGKINGRPVQVSEQL